MQKYPNHSSVTEEFYDLDTKAELKSQAVEEARKIFMLGPTTPSVPGPKRSVLNVGWAADLTPLTANFARFSSEWAGSKGNAW